MNERSSSRSAAPSGPEIFWKTRSVAFSFSYQNAVRTSKSTRPTRSVSTWYRT